MKIITGTLCFLVRENEKTGETEVCLAWKEPTPNALKLGIADKWNGYGGKVEENDGPIVNTCIREVVQESGVRVKIEDLEKVALITYRQPGKGDFDCHIFIARTAGAVPRSTREMTKPTWFSVDTIPYHAMMSGDILILPSILVGKKIAGVIAYHTDMTVNTGETKLTIVENL